MIIRKKCTVTICIAVTLLLLLAVNIVVYFIVDSGFKLNAFDPFKENYQVKEKNTLPVVEKKNDVVPAAKSAQAKAAPNQKFLAAPQNGLLPASFNAAKRILSCLRDIADQYKNETKSYQPVLQAVLKDLRLTDQTGRNVSSIAEKWVTGTQVVPKFSPQLGTVLNTLCSSKIVKADNSKRGTQLKLLLTLEGGQKALFKPKWYERDAVIPGPVYAGKDRHNAEVAAFHLSILLGFRKVPLTVGRRIDLRREVMPVATPALRETFFQEGNNTCFYGVCFYCSPADPVCAQRDAMEGALILWLPQKFTFARYTHPWQRSYRHNLVARWEVEENYCAKVKKSKAYAMESSDRLLDLADTAIFDFLVDNGDRHHFEAPINVKPSAVFLFDNGKSFGNPAEDHLDILAPLYQCCVLRRKTWQSLLNYRGGALSSSLKKTLEESHIAPVLTDAHLQALDRRLLLVYAAVEVCLRDNLKIPVLF